MDLVNELNNLQKQLDYSIKQLRVNGSAFAKAERDYKIALNKKALELRSQDMAVTLIQTIIYGYEDIAELRFLRDSAEVVYNSNQEAINSIKLRMRLIDNQIQREYSNDGKANL